MKRPKLAGEPPALIDAFVLRGSMIKQLADKCGRYARELQRVRQENAELRVRVRTMAGHR